MAGGGAVKAIVVLNALRALDMAYAAVTGKDGELAADLYLAARDLRNALAADITQISVQRLAEEAEQ